MPTDQTPTDQTPTEEQARALLARAAATIDVDEAASMTLTGLPEPRPRRWPLLAAAAAVVLVVVGGYVAAQQFDGEERPQPATTEDERSDRRPVEQEHVYDDDQMPALIGYTETEATELLHARGYAIEVIATHDCDRPAGYVVGTDPGPGTAMAAGERVQVEVTAGPSPAVRCARSRVPWPQVLDLVRFARGLGPAPEFHSEVAIAVGTGRHVVLTAKEAAVPESWVLCADGACHSALGALAEMVTDRAGNSGIFVSLGLAATQGLGSGLSWDCVTPDPYEHGFRVRPATYVFMDDPTTDRACPRPPVVQVEWSEDRRIAGVRLRLPIRTGPTQPASLLEPTPQRAATADAFVRWARGEGPPPAFADRVRLMFHGHKAFGNVAWLEPPYTRDRFAGCSGLGFPHCGLDPVATILRHDGPVGATAGRGACPAGGDVPQPLYRAHGDVVTLAASEPGPCRSAWTVELWIDDGGAIYGLNQIGGIT